MLVNKYYLTTDLRIPRTIKIKNKVTGEIEERETIIAFSSLPLSYKDTLKTTIPVFRVNLDILKEFEGQKLNIAGLGNNGIVKLELNSMFISVPVFFINKIYLSDGN